MNQVLTIFFDGGCRPTNPGNKYGSFEVLLNGRSVRLEHEREFGPGTNNEAEFDALQAALDWTLANMRTAGLEATAYAVEVFTDSMILANRIRGRNRSHKSEPERRMQAHAEQCLIRLSQFRKFRVEWRPREENMLRFGH